MAETETIRSLGAPFTAHLNREVQPRATDRAMCGGPPVDGRQRTACRGVRESLAAQPHRPGAHRLGNVLERLWTDVIKCDIDFGSDLTLRVVQNAYSASLGNCLKASRNVNTIAKNIIVVGNDITDVTPVAVRLARRSKASLQENLHFPAHQSVSRPDRARAGFRNGSNA